MLMNIGFEPRKGLSQAANQSESRPAAKKHHSQGGPFILHEHPKHAIIHHLVLGLQKMTQLGHDSRLPIVGVHQ